mmetsp:Transcript_118868/g.341371  ORF Transcript_118868/g.341371 Transcript_118868/m.341371 type:complete len:237 (-) Transcript_118868:1984-2694(-)
MTWISMCGRTSATHQAPGGKGKYNATPSKSIFRGFMGRTCFQLSLARCKAMVEDATPLHFATIWYRYNLLGSTVSTSGKLRSLILSSTKFATRLATNLDSPSFGSYHAPRCAVNKAAIGPRPWSSGEMHRLGSGVSCTWAMTSKSIRPTGANLSTMSEGANNVRGLTRRPVPDRNDCERGTTSSTRSTTGAACVGSGAKIFQRGIVPAKRVTCSSEFAPFSTMSTPISHSSRKSNA